MMFLAYDCTAINPILRLLKFGIIPIIQVVIIAALIILLIIDFGKAVMAGKEDEIKAAQKLAIKRVVYALIVFLVPWIVNVSITLLAHAKDDKDQTTAATDAGSAWVCWDTLTK